MPESKHAMVRRQLLTVIDGLRPQAALPTERALAAQFGVSRMTLRNVLAELASEGRVHSVQGVGTFVSEPRLSKEVLVSSFTEDMQRRGHTPSSRVLMAQAVPASRDIAQALGIEPGATVYNVERLRLADAQPVCIEDAHFPSAELPGLLEQDLTSSLYAIIRTRYERRIERAVTTVSAKALSRREANLLADRPRAAALRFERVTFDNRGRPIEHCDTIYRSGRFDLRYTVDL